MSRTFRRAPRWVDRGDTAVFRIQKITDKENDGYEYDGVAVAYDKKNGLCRFSYNWDYIDGNPSRIRRRAGHTLCFLGIEDWLEERDINARRRDEEEYWAWDGEQEGYEFLNNYLMDEHYEDLWGEDYNYDYEPLSYS